MDPLMLEQVSNMAEIIGVIMIIISLIYVGREISENNRAKRIAAIQVHNDAFRMNLSLVADHAASWAKGLESYSTLVTSEKVEFAAVMQSSIRHLEQSYFMMNEGVLRESLFNNARMLVRDLMSYPGTKEWWITRRAYFDSEFVESLEAYIHGNAGKEMY